MILLNVKLQVILSIFILLMLANFKRVVILGIEHSIRYQSITGRNTAEELQTGERAVGGAGNEAAPPREQRSTFY